MPPRLRPVPRRRARANPRAEFSALPRTPHSDRPADHFRIAVPRLELHLPPLLKGPPSHARDLFRRAPCRDRATARWRTLSRRPRRYAAAPFRPACARRRLEARSPGPPLSDQLRARPAVPPDICRHARRSGRLPACPYCFPAYAHATEAKTRSFCRTNGSIPPRRTQFPPQFARHPADDPTPVSRSGWRQGAPPDTCFRRRLHQRHCAETDSVPHRLHRPHPQRCPVVFYPRSRTDESTWTPLTLWRSRAHSRTVPHRRVGTLANRHIPSFRHRSSAALQAAPEYYVAYRRSRAGSAVDYHRATGLPAAQRLEAALSRSRLSYLYGSGTGSSPGDRGLFSALGYRGELSRRKNTAGRRSGRKYARSIRWNRLPLSRSRLTVCCWSRRNRPLAIPARISCRNQNGRRVPKVHVPQPNRSFINSAPRSGAAASASRVSPASPPISHTTRSPRNALSPSHPPYVTPTDEIYKAKAESRAESLASQNVE